MRVQKVLIENNNKRYILLDQEGFPVIPVMKYINYLDKTGKRPNTQKTYCYSLKHFYIYLEETINLTITVIANFYDYLYRNKKVKNDMMEKLMKLLKGF